MTNTKDNTHISNIKEIQNIVLNLASSSLFGTPITVPNILDWQVLFKEVKKQNIVSLTYPIIKDMDIPTTIKTEWAKERDKYLFNNARNISSHLEIHALFSKANLPYVIIKGIASGSYYPDYLLRTYGDVDFLVHPEDYKKASELLQTNGFQYISEHEKHKLYKKNHITYELHRRIVGIPSGKVGIVFDDYFSDIIECAKPFQHNHSICLIPSDKHHCVILLIHTAEHMVSSGIGLRHLMDWAAFVNRMNDEFFMEMKDTLKEMGIWHYCCILTALCTKYLGLRECHWASPIVSTELEQLLNDVFTLGDFALESDTEVSSIETSTAIHSFFSLLNKRTKRLPIIEKVPILYPLGWVFITVRYAGRILLGKRKLKTAKDTITRYGSRSELLNKLKLFEHEE